MRLQLAYKCQRVMDCEVTKEQRARCQYCRLQKCISVGMVVSDCNYFSLLAPLLLLLTIYVYKQLLSQRGNS